MLQVVDGDVFGKVTRLGRDAADAVARALSGEDAWDPFLAERCLEVLVGAAGGIPSLPVVVAELGALRAAPLLAPTLAEAAVERIHEASLTGETTELDLILRGVAQREVLRGEFQIRSVLERFCAELLDRAILCGRGGFMEQHGVGRIDEARGLLRSVTIDGARVLEKRPTAKRLGIAIRHAHVGSDTNLLGGS